MALAGGQVADEAAAFRIEVVGYSCSWRCLSAHLNFQVHGFHHLAVSNLRSFRQAYTTPVGTDPSSKPLESRVYHPSKPSTGLHQIVETNATKAPTKPATRAAVSTSLSLSAITFGVPVV